MDKKKIDQIATLMGIKIDSFEYKMLVEFCRCMMIVQEHSDEGENTMIAIPDMFPHGMQDIAYECWKKICRFLGYSKSGNRKKARAEMQDIINYAFFGLVIDEMKK